MDEYISWIISVDYITTTKQNNTKSCALYRENYIDRHLCVRVLCSCECVCELISIGPCKKKRNSSALANGVTSLVH